MKALALLVLILGQVEGDEFHLESVAPEKTTVLRGEVVKVAFEVEIDEPWHVYAAKEKLEIGLPTAFVFAGGTPAKVWGAIGQPAPKIVKVEGLPDQEFHEGRFTFVVPVLIAPEAAPGKRAFEGRVTYQLCNDDVCKNGEAAFSFVLEISDAPPVAPVQGGTSEDVLSGGFFAFMLMAVGFGVASLFSPCAFPVLMITLPYFARQGGGMRLAGAYAAGLVITFTGIGLLASAFLGAAGARAIAANPFVNIGFGLVFLYFAGVMFGWLPMKLPAKLTGVTGKQRAGAGGAFVLGCLFSIAAFACTGPLVATVLLMATQGHEAWAVIGML
ncbi:MAG: cytochrome c biogenesis protein CcdA, partial [Planctomycetota bacterium]